MISQLYLASYEILISQMPTNKKIILRLVKQRLGAGHLDLSRCPLLHKSLQTPTLMTTPLKVVTIECIEHEVTA